MSGYKLKTPKRAEEAVTGAYKKIEETVVNTYRKIEDTVVGAYQKVEDGAVGGYKRIEKKFEDAFLEKDGGCGDNADNKDSEARGDIEGCGGAQE